MTIAYIEALAMLDRGYVSVCVPTLHDGVPKVAVYGVPTKGMERHLVSEDRTVRVACLIGAVAAVRTKLAEQGLEPIR